MRPHSNDDIRTVIIAGLLTTALIFASFGFFEDQINRALDIPGQYAKNSEPNVIQLIIGIFGIVIILAANLLWLPSFLVGYWVLIALAGLSILTTACLCLYVGLRGRSETISAQQAPRAQLPRKRSNTLTRGRSNVAKILVSGSTGLIGRALVGRLESSGHDVVRLVRPESRSGVTGITWDPGAGVLDASQLEGFDAVVHLGGENIADRRWSEEQKRRIRDSRVMGTTLLANALARLDSPPSVFLCASAGGYYGDRGDEVLADSADAGTDFLAQVTREWEDSTQPASEAGIRVVNMRISVVLTADGGMLKRVLPIFKLGLGGRLGSGSQYMSWITRQDLIDAIVWVMDHDDLSGGVNVSSPNPVTNAEFTRALGRQIGRPAIFSVPKFALRIAQGDLSDVVLSSIRMEPERLVSSGFEFAHPEIEGALRWAVGDAENAARPA